MIVVIDPKPGTSPIRWETRIVLEEDEPMPALLDIRLALRQAIEYLPGRIDLVPVKRFPDKRKK